MMQIESAAHILDLVDLGSDLGLYPVNREADPLTLEWLVRREVKVLKALRKTLKPAGKAMFDKLMRLVDDVDWETVDPKDGQAVITAMTTQVEAMAGAFAKTGGTIVGKAASSVYEDVRRLVSAKPKLKFDLVDKAAVKWIQKDPNWWIQRAYGPELSASIQASAENALVGGVGRKELASVLEAKLGAAYQEYRYWDVLASASLNRSRGWGAVKTWSEQGATKYEIVAANDERTCDTCGALDGTVMSVEKAAKHFESTIANVEDPDEFKAMNPWISVKGKGDDQEFYAGGDDVTDQFNAMTPGEADDGSDLQDFGVNAPPFHGNCLLPGTIVQGAFVGGSRARYTGQAVELRTRVGRCLSVTANHPILTDHGFVPAGEIREGDQLVGYLDQPGIGVLRLGSERDEDHAPASVEDVFGALAQCGVSVAVPASSDDFHGEAARFDGEVDVVGTYRALLSASYAANVEKSDKRILEVPATGDALVARACGSDQLLIGDDSPRRSFPCARALPLDGGSVGFERGPLRALRVGSAAQNDAMLDEHTSEGVPGDVNLASELLHGRACDVALDAVVDVRHFDFSGHVFDFQTVTGWMVAECIVVSNCRCTVAALD